MANTGSKNQGRGRTFYFWISGPLTRFIYQKKVSWWRLLTTVKSTPLIHQSVICGLVGLWVGRPHKRYRTMEPFSSFWVEMHNFWPIEGAKEGDETDGVIANHDPVRPSPKQLHTSSCTRTSRRLREPDAGCTQHWTNLFVPLCSLSL